MTSVLGLTTSAQSRFYRAQERALRDRGVDYETVESARVVLTGPLLLRKYPSVHFWNCKTNLANLCQYIE